MPADVRAVVVACCERCAPHEAVGAILALPEGGLEVVPLPNVARTPRVAFEIAPLDWLALEELRRARGASLAWLFHSHVEAPAVPSSRDVAWFLPGGAPAFGDAGLLLVEVRGGRVSRLVGHRPRRCGPLNTWALDEPVEWLSSSRFSYRGPASSDLISGEGWTGMADNQGFTVWLTGMLGAGKTTMAGYIAARLRQVGRLVEVLDEDELGEVFWGELQLETKDDRTTVARRLGALAEVLTRNSVAVLVACASPYKAIREENRRRIGRYLEVYVDCPTEDLIKRDTTGQYKKALTGEIPNFTGITEPYEPPTSPEVVIKTNVESVEEGGLRIFQALLDLGHVSADDVKTITGTRLKPSAMKPRKALAPVRASKAKAEKPAKPAKPAKAARSEKPAKAEKAEKSARSPKGEKSKRPVKLAARTAKASRAKAGKGKKK